MNIYEKLQKCRVELQNSNLKKTGKISCKIIFLCNNKYEHHKIKDFR